jgi:hypothetical protein
MLFPLEMTIKVYTQELNIFVNIKILIIIFYM